MSCWVDGIILNQINLMNTIFSAAEMTSIFNLHNLGQRWSFSICIWSASATWFYSSSNVVKTFTIILKDLHSIPWILFWDDFIHSPQCRKASSRPPQVPSNMVFPPMTFSWGCLYWFEHRIQNLTTSPAWQKSH